MPHDLMSPHVVLNDMASISRIIDYRKKTGLKAEPALLGGSDSSKEDFVSSVEFALAKTWLKTSNLHHWSMDHIEKSKRHHSNDHEVTDSAHSTPNSAEIFNEYRGQPRGKVHRFEVLREGVYIATVLLGRTVFRLGEMIPTIIDFQNSAVHCHSLTAILESSEIVDPADALRSPASIYRATRRIYASFFELTLFQRRATFSPVAPSNATPNFQTSSVSLAWTLRFEFMISRKDGNGTQETFLDEVTRNERGSVCAAVPMFSCEKFEATVPLNVYGCASSPYSTIKPDEYFI